MNLDEAAWKRLEAHAESGLAKALADGRGVDALAMMEAHKRIGDELRSWRTARQQAETSRAAQGGALP